MQVVETMLKMQVVDTMLKMLLVVKTQYVLIADAKEL